MRHSVTVWDSEAQARGGQPNETNRWGNDILGVAIQKAGPKHADKLIAGVYSRRNDTGDGVIFEWD